MQSIASPAFANLLHLLLHVCSLEHFRFLATKLISFNMLNVPGAPHGKCWWALHVLVKLLMRTAHTLGEGNLAASEVVKIMFLLARMGGKTSCDKERFLAVLADSKNGTAQPESQSLVLA